MSVKDRLKSFIASSGLTNQRFEAEAGLSNGYVANMRKGVGNDALERISNTFPDLNTVWLLTGEGKMLKTDASAAPKDENIFTVPLLPIAAQGGKLNDFVVSVHFEDCEKIVSPIKGVDFAMPVAGDSMAPEYPSGSQILVKRINEKAFIEWGKVYALDTCNGTVIKEVHKGETDDDVKCVSINPDPKFSPFSVKMADIYGMYKVVMSMALK